MFCSIASSAIVRVLNGPDIVPPAGCCVTVQTKLIAPPSISLAGFASITAVTFASKGLAGLLDKVMFGGLPVTLNVCIDELLQTPLASLTRKVTCQLVPGN